MIVFTAEENRLFAGKLSLPRTPIVKTSKGNRELASNHSPRVSIVKLIISSRRVAITRCGDRSRLRISPDSDCYRGLIVRTVVAQGRALGSG